IITKNTAGANDSAVSCLETGPYCRSGVDDCARAQNTVLPDDQWWIFVAWVLVTVRQLLPQDALRADKGTATDYGVFVNHRTGFYDHVVLDYRTIGDVDKRCQPDILADSGRLADTICGW